MNRIKIFLQDWLQNAQAGCNDPVFVNYVENKIEEWAVLKRKLSLIQ
jgi:hypothetical protein